ncbi:pre-rRNA processing protein [Aspergillus saccharolyticus JOP 1030-1]|uniref:Pre-rRNA processing protein n=1 Tax=Aspergillus saccharolyticus JOP 1030-1 TaxID=1450539 RepID=A0A319AIR1_9EURO|nr:pre-rRNA processing protein [Aspergillus saccharolyticus JOP 1030-1]PYH46562.1 pre-rRNA processing protein [Aspergillus saccharolyticus JOP 1030-1]
MATNTNPTAPPEGTNYLDLGITLALNNWPALTLAVQSNWGGPTSSDKRDWLCGAISEMLAERPETDSYDLEDVLVQVMTDEFDVDVDDESAAAVADQIMELKAQTERGEYATIQQMWEVYQRKGGAQGAVAGIQRGAAADGDSDDDEDDEDEDEEDGMDVDMEDATAPALVRAPREKAEPEVDEDGFTTVVSKKRR